MGRKSRRVSSLCSAPSAEVMPCSVLLEVLSEQFIADAIDGRIKWKDYERSQNVSGKRSKIKRKTGNKKRVLRTPEIASLEVPTEATDTESATMSDYSPSMHSDDEEFVVTSSKKGGSQSSGRRGRATRSKSRHRRGDSVDSDSLDYGDFDINDSELSNLKDIHKCKECTFTTNCKQNLIMHTGKHRNTCYICDLKLNTRTECDEHILQNHTPVIEKCIYYGCSKCSKPFKTEVEFKEHVTLHLEQSVIDQGQFVCIFCFNRFSKEISLINHMKKSHLLYRCTFCPKLAAKFDSLERHCQTLHWYFKKPFKCSFCDFEFAIFGSLTVHRKQCHALEWCDGKEKCRFCNCEFTEDIEALAHLASHVDMYFYKCYSCQFALV